MTSIVCSKSRLDRASRSSRYNHYVAAIQGAQKTGELRTIRSCARLLLRKYLGAARRAQRFFLQRQILTVGRDPRITVNGHFDILNES